MSKALAAPRSRNTKEEAAEAKWKRDVASADIVRRGTVLDLQLGVLGVPRTGVPLT